PSGLVQRVRRRAPRIASDEAADRLADLRHPPGSAGRDGMKMDRICHLATRHPLTRRDLLQAGALGFLGVSMADVLESRARAAESGGMLPKARSVIFLFLTGGPSQHDTFDMKPNAPDEVRGEFRPIATSTPGIDICEHMPMLAQRSR